MKKSSACNFIKKETLVQVFSCEFCDISKNTYSYRTPLVAASQWCNQVYVKFVSIVNFILRQTFFLKLYATLLNLPTKTFLIFVFSFFVFHSTVSAQRRMLHLIQTKQVIWIWWNHVWKITYALLHEE